MALKILDHLFTGPFALEETRLRKNHDPVVYAIVCKAGEPWNPTFRLLDVGESGDQDLDFARHARRDDWERQSDGEVSVYFLTFPRREGHSEADRQGIATAIGEALDPPNGMISIEAGV